MRGGGAHEVADLRHQVSRLRGEAEVAQKVIVDQREQIERLIDSNHRLMGSASPQAGLVEKLRDELLRSRQRERELNELCVGLACYIGELAKDLDQNCNEELHEVLHDLDVLIAKHGLEAKVPPT